MPPAPTTLGLMCVPAMLGIRAMGITSALILMNVQRLLVYALPHLVIKAVKICQAPTTARAAVASKVMGRAVWTSTNVQTTSAVYMQTV